jgi:glycosyltransferase involved in cell wall biosynthesis
MESNRPAPTTSHSAPGFAVIVPVYRQWNHLQRLLEALSRLEIPTAGFEVIVVNNDEPQRRPESLDAHGLSLRIVDDDKPGSYRARNAGVAATSRRYLAFTDADCLPEPEWLTEAEKLFVDGVDLVAGEVRPMRNGSRSLAELYSHLMAPRQEKYVQNCEAMTANLLVSRDVFLATGGFKDELYSGGDFEWTRRASERYRLTYSPNVVVNHSLRTTLSEVFAKRKRVVGGMVELSRLRGERMPWLVWFLPPRLCWDICFKQGISVVDRIRIASLRYAVHLYGTFFRFLFTFRLMTPPRT